MPENPETRCEMPNAPEGESASPQAPTPSDGELAGLAKAIGHPARLRILRYLASQSSCTCGDIVGEVSLAQSTVSEHLKVLKNAGLIKGEIDPPRVCYCINPTVLRRLKDLVAGL